MGIRGLTRAVAKFTTPHRPEYLRRGVFYVDGLNFSHTIALSLSGRKKESAHAEFVGKTTAKIKAIMRLGPSQVTFYFDAMLPKDKAVIRHARQIEKLRRLHHRQVIFPHDLLMYIIHSQFPSIKVVFTGREAEDEIASDIFSACSGPTARHRHVIFSSDSDVFTFVLPNAELVEIVPLDNITSSGYMASINLGAVHAENVVFPQYLREMPLPSLGKRWEGTNTIPRRLLEFINSAVVSKEFTIYLQLIYSPEIAGPYEAGATIRKAVYGLILRHDFDGEYHQITEILQNGSDMITSVVEPLVADDLDEKVASLGQTPFLETVTAELQAVASKFELEPAHIRAAVQYVADLIAGQTPDPAEELYTAASELDSLLRAVLVSLYYYNGLMLRNHIETPYFLLPWKLSPYELSNYL